MVWGKRPRPALTSLTLTKRPVVRRLIRKRGEKGANLVEFALVMPFLLILLFGIVEFAWVFATNLDVKHGAREGARKTLTWS